MSDQFLNFSLTNKQYLQMQQFVSKLHHFDEFDRNKQK